MTSEEAVKFLFQIADEMQNQLDKSRVPRRQWTYGKRIEAISVAISALREQEDHVPGSGKMIGWIRAEERLPDDSFMEKEIIVCILNRFGERNVYTKKFWGLKSALWNNDITHWMPLPEPPKEVDWQ